MSTEIGSAWTGLPGRVVAAALSASSSSADGRIFRGEEETAPACERPPTIGIGGVPNRSQYRSFEGGRDEIELTLLTFLLTVLRCFL